MQVGQVQERVRRPGRPRRRGAMVALVFAISASLGFAGTSAGSALANNDSYCGHGTGHIAYHQWHTYRWRNIWASHSRPAGYRTGHWNHYVKQRQPSYYPGTELSWLWFDGGEIWK